MNPVLLLGELKRERAFSTSELCTMLNEVEMFLPRDGYMEHVIIKCEKLILDRLYRTPREGR